MYLLTVICQSKAKLLPCVTEVLNQMGLGMRNSYDYYNHRDKNEEQIRYKKEMEWKIMWRHSPNIWKIS